MDRIARFAAVGAALVLPLLASSPASAAPPQDAGTFGQHVRVCAQLVGFSGDHNPGMHHGAAGWDGMPCQP